MATWPAITPFPMARLWRNGALLNHHLGMRLRPGRDRDGERTDSPTNVRKIRTSSVGMRKRPRPVLGELHGRYCEQWARCMAQHTLRGAASHIVKYAMVTGSWHANKVHVIFNSSI
jgi:hypothetical protein